LDGDGRLLLGAAIPGGKGYLRGEAPLGLDAAGENWSVAVAAPMREFLRRPLTNLLGATILFSVLAALLLMLIIVLRVSDLMGPIHGMVEGTKRFAAGDLTFRFAHLKTVELDGLASSFNRMAETLETRNRELEQKLRQLTSLRDLEEAVIQRQDEELVLRTCLEAVARGFAFDRTGLYWVDAGTREIVGRYLFGSEAAGFTEASFRRRRVSFETDDILNQVARNRAAIVVRKPSDDPRVDPGFVMEAKTREFCMAPICGKDRVLGIITADNYYSNRSIQDADRDGLMLFANAVGLALENAMLFQNLAESEAKLRTVLENSPEAIVGLSREQWITTWNRGAEKIFGLSAAEALGKPLTILFPRSAGNEFKRLLNQVIEKGSVRDFAMPGQTKEGRPLDLSVSWGGHHQDFWMNKEWTLVVRDITEAHRLQQQLIRSEKLSAVGQLISGIAHELNNPLQAVVGYADILSDDMRQKTEAAPGGEVLMKPQELVDDLRIITDNAMRCQKIIENLLLFVRQGEIEKRPVDLPKVIQASRELLQYKLKKAANVHVELSVPDLLPKARGNFQQLEQVFVNLINNACDAMGAGPRKKTIRISMREANAGLIRVELADNGPGVPESLRGRLFEPFFTTKGEGRGTGLGLAVCRQIIEDHGGKIGFTSEENQGTTFWIELPAAREEAAFLQTEAAAQPVVTGKSLLIVDDEPDVLGFLTKVILATGNHVEVAGTLKDAIQKAGERAFDLVLTDIRLGEGTGFTLYENWSLWTRHPRPGFLFMTGDVLNGAVIQDIEKRGLHMLHKPLDLATFQNTLNKALAGPVQENDSLGAPLKNAKEGMDRATGAESL
jgi:two-component system NtrC family sensor kinase